MLRMFILTSLRLPIHLPVYKRHKLGADGIDSRGSSTEELTEQLEGGETLKGFVVRSCAYN